MKANEGFTLIEVLLAIALIAISLTALLKSISYNINFSDRLKNNTINHLVSEHAIALIQLGLLPIDDKHEVSEVTNLMNKNFYWHARLIPTEIKSLKIIKISTSEKPTGPFKETLTGFQFKP